jgi:hypothetical protein
MLNKTSTREASGRLAPTPGPNARRDRLRHVRPNNGTFALAVIEAWAAQVSDEALPSGIADLRTALREEN